jgi:hypothetical protein
MSRQRGQMIMGRAWGKRVDHESIDRSRCSRTMDNGTGCSSPQGEPVDAEPVALARDRSSGYAAVALDPALPAGRCGGLASSGSGVSIRRLESGKWFAVLKSGRAYVAGKTFATRREAQAWLTRERAALAGGIDPRAGRPFGSDASAGVAGRAPACRLGQDVQVGCRTPPVDADLPHRFATRGCDRSRGEPGAHRLGARRTG